MDTEISEENRSVSQNAASLIDNHVFTPIASNWRKKYYAVTFRKRFFAYLLDYVFTFILFLPFNLIVFAVTDGMDQSAAQGLRFLLIPIQFALFILYCAIFESSNWQGTIGKRILKIQITDLDGYSISFSRSIVRNIFKILATWSYFLIIPLIIQIATYEKTKKVFHDYLSKTLIGVRLPGNTLKSKLSLNIKLIFQFSLFGIVIALVDIFLPQIPQNNIFMYYVCINVAYIFIAYSLAKKLQGKYTMHGFWVGLFSTILILILKIILFDTYKDNMLVLNPDFKEENISKISIVFGGIIGLFYSSLAIAFFTSAASEIIKKKKHKG